MDFEAYNKITKPKTVDAVHINGRYVEVSRFKSRIVKVAATAAAVIAALAFAFIVFT